MKLISTIFLILFAGAIIYSCEEIKSYPEEPEIEYKSYTITETTDILGNKIFLLTLAIGFVDGDGNIGLNQPDSTNIPDSLKYNIFMTSHYKEDGRYIEISDQAGSQNYRIPYIEREGQNKTLKGTISVELEFKTIKYDTMMYSMYIRDRDLNRSNVDSTEDVIFTDFSFED